MTKSSCNVFLALLLFLGYLYLCLSQVCCLVSHLCICKISSWQVFTEKVKIRLSMRPRSPMTNDLWWFPGGLKGRITSTKSGNYTWKGGNSCLPDRSRSALNSVKNHSWNVETTPKRWKIYRRDSLIFSMFPEIPCYLKVQKTTPEKVETIPWKMKNLLVIP